MEIPKSIVIAWSGAINEIPDGWVLCDGIIGSGTPDLRNRFIVGVGSNYSLNDEGGNKDSVVVSHTHSGSTNTVGNHTHAGTTRHSGTSGANIGRGNADNSIVTSLGGGHSHSVSTSTIGVSPIDRNLPPYYALAFIMKT